jgi:hypothetical protein
MKLSDIQNRIIASPHLSEEKLLETVTQDIAAAAWHMRNLKWNIHMNVYKHRHIPEDQGLNELGDMMIDIMSVTHPLLDQAQRAFRLYLSQEFVSKATIAKMIKLQDKHQDEGRDQIELSSRVMSYPAPRLPRVER